MTAYLQNLTFSGTEKNTHLDIINKTLNTLHIYRYMTLRSQSEIKNISQHTSVPSALRFKSLQFVAPQVNNSQPTRSPDRLLILFSEPESLPCFLLLPLKPLRVCLPKQIRVYLIKLKRAIWLLILTSNSYLLVSFIDQFSLLIWGLLVCFFCVCLVRFFKQLIPTFK